MKKILLTGSTGFVGAAVLESLRSKGREVICPVRNVVSPNQLRVGELDAATDWNLALDDVGWVIHSAGRAHVIDDLAADSLAAFRKVNVEGTLNLARQAAHRGVERFVYLSSAKVNGESTTGGSPFVADHVAAPQDPYAISKFEAEQGLRSIAKQSAMEVVIIRPVLVYGPGVKANFRSMMKWLSRGIPLPLGAIDNRRSLVALENLVDLIGTCIGHPAAANQTFLVSDGEDVSTSELLRRLALALGKPARLLPVPAWMLRSAAALLSKGDVALRLCGSMQVDITKTKGLLNWTPPVSLDDGLARTARDFLEHPFS